MLRIERVVALTTMFLIACGGGDDDDQIVDATPPGPDAAEADASAEPIDARIVDAPVMDASQDDASQDDASQDDGSQDDASAQDAPMTDAFAPDAEPPDAEPPDAEPPDAEPPDAEPPDAEPLDAETAIPTAFRPDSLVLRDPHTFLPFLSCQDITDNPFLGISANGLLDDAVTTDSDPTDGMLDLSLLAIFRPLDQSLDENPGELAFGDCTAPMLDTTCDLTSGSTPQPTAFTNVATGVCLEPHPGTTSAYTPAVAVPTDDCFYSGQVAMNIPFLGTTLAFEDADVAAEYVDDPATGMVNVLIRGFISETVAQNTIVDLPILGHTPLSDLLAGGTGCDIGHDDRDLGPDGETLGWWFYFNGTAVLVSYVGP